MAKWFSGWSMNSQAQKAEAFRALHAGEPFVIPNPWDAGSAKVLAALGFRALASTSSGFAFTLGRLDGGATLDEVVAHARALDQATDLPVSVDLENGYGPSPSTRPTRSPQLPKRARWEARSRTTTPRPGSTSSGVRPSAWQPPSRPPAASAFPFTLTARAENHIRGNPDLDDTIVRLQAFEEAGADVLYAPGLVTVEQIQRSASRPPGR